MHNDGYKQTEVGLIPVDWEVVKIEQIGMVGRGRVISHKEISKSFNPQYPVYSSQTSNDGVMGYLDNFEFEGEYITWTTDGANAGTVFFRSGRFNCTNVCGTIKLKKDYHLFVAKMLSRFTFNHVSRHLGNPKLMNDVMKRIQIPLPPTLAEQHAIAEALSDADALIEALAQLIAKHRALKQGAMQELFRPKKHWETTTLGCLGVFLKGSGVKKDDAKSGEIPCIRYGEIYTHHNNYIKNIYSWISPEVANGARRIKRGDVLFAGSGETKEEIGKCVAFIGDFIAYAGGDIVIFRSERTDPLFFGYYLNTTDINRQKASKGQGDAVVHISAKALSDINVCIPPLAEQTAIAAVLSDMDAEIAALEGKLAKAQQIKQGMMQELLTGRVRLV